MIKDILGFKIFNSRGEPTILVKTITERGIFYGSAPSGASVGKYEAKTVDIETSLKILKKIKRFLSYKTKILALSPLKKKRKSFFLGQLFISFFFQSPKGKIIFLSQDLFRKDKK